MYKMILYASLILVLVGASSGVSKYSGVNLRNIKYQNELTLDLSVAKINKKVIYDDIEKREVTLYQYVSADGYPVFYSRNIHTGVCYDNQCKLLNITIYWNPTGRYLGFELPEKEFLSKDDHVPFTDEEYVRLNGLLSDPDLPLGQFTYNQIAAKSKAALYNVDGVSGATAKDVLEYVIKGSAYTTYTIYELVYGDTKSEVEAWTDEMLTDDFLEKILTKSPYPDQLWAINVVHGRLSDLPKTKEIILDLIDSPDYSVAEKSLNSFVSEDFNDQAVQNSLIDKFKSFDFGMKALTIKLLKDSPQLSTEVVKQLNKDLYDMEVPIISGILDLYQDKRIKDLETISLVQKIADSDNRYLAKKAEGYLTMVIK